MKIDYQHGGRYPGLVSIISGSVKDTQVYKRNKNKKRLLKKDTLM